MSSQRPTTTIVFWKMAARQVRDQFWAFKQVPLATAALAKVPGLTFFKSMGAGGFGGFSSVPSFRDYCWVMVWQSERHARAFFASNPYWAEYTARAVGRRILHCDVLASHGAWSGSDPFPAPVLEGPRHEGPIVVLTRARIANRRLLHFWLRVGKSAQKLKDHPALDFAIGVGELPLIQQATVSVWQSEAAMKAYAYGDEAHRKVIQLTRKFNWYSEELFARFRLTEVQESGVLQGLATGFQAKSPQRSA